MIRALLLTMFFMSNLKATIILNDDDYFKNLNKKITYLDHKLIPDGEEIKPLRSNQIKLQIMINKNSNWTPVKEIKYKLTFSDGDSVYLKDEKVLNLDKCKLSEKFKIKATLKNRYYNVKNNRYKTYTLHAEGRCGEFKTYIFDHDSKSGQAVSIWQVATRITNKLKKINTLSFWKKRLNITYPARGDYYNFLGVHITKGYKWDIVGHEIGHAVYKMASIGHFGTGKHSIDKCYTNALALSEGWASFFSAWASIDLNDNDAKFEYMVPRRAPLAVEHIPSDVCHGMTNEWRTFGFLWDLIDYHNDNVQFSINFKNLWDLTYRKKFKTLESLKNYLITKGNDPVLINILWDHNLNDIL